MKPTIDQILYSAKALLRQLEQTDKDGVDYYEYEEAKHLKRLIDDYERKEDNPRLRQQPTGKSIRGEGEETPVRDIRHGLPRSEALGDRDDLRGIHAGARGTD